MKSELRSIRRKRTSSTPIAETIGVEEVFVYFPSEKVSIPFLK